MTEPQIRLTDVTKVFGRGPRAVTAVEGFSLDVAEGEVVTIVGASGCGKSTILNLLAGFLRADSGDVLLRGRPIRGVEPRCGMVFQNYALFPWMSVRKNVEFGPRLKGVSKRERRERAQRTIEATGLAGFEDAWPGQLSGGMKQRVALCRVLANEPEVLLCDEPFAALDAMTRQVLQEELLGVVNRTGRTMLFITHSIDEALILSDRVIVMSARPGRVKVEMANELPRPRRVEVQLSEEFLAMKRRIWTAVEEEVTASMNLRSSP